MKSFFDFAERYGARPGGFRDLMGHRIRHVLLVSSLYESFILAEDGHLHERVLGKFLEAGRREPPDLTRVSSGREALKLLKDAHRDVDLVIASPDLGDMNALELAQAIGAAGLHVPLALLGYDRDELRPFDDERDGSTIVASFLYQGDARILMSIVQAVEDRLNVERDSRIGVPTFLVVEDNVRFYSAFLPVIYSEVMDLVRSSQAEAGNRLQRIMRQRARPKVLLSTTYERAYRDFERYRTSIMGVFSDMQFPKGGASHADAGQDLARAIREMEPDVPIALQSSHEENSRVAEELGVGFLLKGSPDFLGQLRQYLRGHLFFGDFVFRDEDGGELDRAQDLRSLVDRLEVVPAESVAYHALRHDFSRWLRAHGEIGLANTLRPRRLGDFPSVEALRDNLIHDIDRYRRERSRGSVNPFQSEVFHGEEGIVQIGEGSLGGKGRGLAFASRLLDEVRLSDRFPGVRLSVPSAVVLGTGAFDDFMDSNNLRASALEADDEEGTVDRIMAAPLPEDIREALRRVIAVVKGPLAVRSSSLLEDSPQQPLSGVYGTWILPNEHPDPEVRLSQLTHAVKRVYASTFGRAARTFLEATPYRLEEEAMAVVIQRLVGRKHGSRFYPHISGVARSHNFYPTPPARPEDGIAAVALGLGKAVAGGEPCLRFSPPHPGHVVDHSTVEAMLENTQREFWALCLDTTDTRDWAHDGPLKKYALKTAEEDGALGSLASTYSAANNAIYDGIGRPGVRLVSFAPILKHDVFPLAEIIRELLILGMAGTRLPVEIEFAVALPESKDDVAEFGFLQLRPLAPSKEDADVDLERLTDGQAFCESPSVMGHGRVSVQHWIVVDRNRFERSRSKECAEVVARFNGLLAEEGHPYGLIGVGRWGSTHPWLGIPVRWEDISGARVIVEAGFRDFRVTPSQGTHFYQNIASLNVGYFTVNQDIGEGFVDWDWLESLPALESVGSVRLIRLEEPAISIIDGKERRGVILRPGEVL